MDTCPSCKNEIDPDTCWCGSPIEGHGIYDGHSPIAMGCTCGYDKPQEPTTGVAKCVTQ